MKIAFVTTEFVTEPDTFHGGLANYLGRISEYLVSKGHEVHILVAGNRSEEINYRGVKVHVYDYEDIWSSRRKLSIRCIWQGWRIRKQLIQLDKENRLDIIQYSSYRATGLFRLLRKKVIVRVSTHERLTRLALNETKTVSLDLRIKEFLELAAMKFADRVFAPSIFTASKVSKDIRKSVQTIKTPFALDTKEEEFDYSVYEENLKQRKYILYFGKLSIGKGMRLITKEIKQILALDKNIHFVLVGSDQGWIEKIAAAAGQDSDRVIYLGRLTHDKLYPIISKAHVILLPSLIDNYPNACLEAMSFGKVVIGARGATFEEIITDGENGILFEAGNANDMLNRIKLTLDLNDAELKEISVNARETVESHSTDILGQKLIDYYEEILK